MHVLSSQSTGPGTATARLPSVTSVVLPRPPATFSSRPLNGHGLAPVTFGSAQLCGNSAGIIELPDDILDDATATSSSCNGFPSISTIPTTSFTSLLQPTTSGTLLAANQILSLAMSPTNQSQFDARHTNARQDGSALLSPIGAYGIPPALPDNILLPTTLLPSASTLTNGTTTMMSALELSPVPARGQMTSQHNGRSVEPGLDQNSTAQSNMSIDAILHSTTPIKLLPAADLDAILQMNGGFDSSSLFGVLSSTAPQPDSSMPPVLRIKRELKTSTSLTPQVIDATDQSIFVHRVSSQQCSSNNNNTRNAVDSVVESVAQGFANMSSTPSSSHQSPGRKSSRPRKANTTFDNSNSPSTSNGPSPPKRRKPSTPSASNGAIHASTSGDDSPIDTRGVCVAVMAQLKEHSIPQAVFSERVLGRSQGTLSDLLRNPKPWDKLKAGRETFRRMQAWLNLPLPGRLVMLEMWKGSTGVTPTTSTAICSTSSPLPTTTTPHTPTPPTPPPPTLPPPTAHHSSGVKRPRLVFTDIQKRTLHAIFRETQRPSRDMQSTIADHLGLDVSTVQNFFMNARRRSRDRTELGAKQGESSFADEASLMRHVAEQRDEDLGAIADESMDFLFAQSPSGQSDSSHLPGEPVLQQQNNSRDAATPPYRVQKEKQPVQQPPEPCSSIEQTIEDVLERVRHLPTMETDSSFMDDDASINCAIDSVLCTSAVSQLVEETHQQRLSDAGRHSSDASVTTLQNMQVPAAQHAGVEAGHAGVEAEQQQQYATQPQNHLRKRLPPVTRFREVLASASPSSCGTPSPSSSVCNVLDGLVRAVESPLVQTPQLQ